MKRSLNIVVPAVALAALGCQDVEKPSTVLTQQQWKEVEGNLLETAPTPEVAIGAIFGGQIELIGYDVSKPFSPGKPATFTFYWRVLEDVKQNWKVFVHFDSMTRPFRKGFDHVPVDGLFETTRWRKGQIIKDVFTQTLQNDYPLGDARPFIGFYKGKERLPITNEVPKTKDSRVRGPIIPITSDGSAPVTKDGLYPVHTVERVAGASVTVDGKLDEPQWAVARSLELRPFSKGDVTTTAKLFYTADALYIGAEIEDKDIWGTLTQRDADTWTEEVLEVFIDVDSDGDDYLELQVTPKNVVFDANFKKRLTRGPTRNEQIDTARAWNMAGLQTAVFTEGTLDDASDEDRRWFVEIALPFASMPGLDGPPKAGDTWSLNMYRFDRPDRKGSRAYAWSTGPRGDFHEVAKFGKLRFLGPPNAKLKTVDPKKLLRIDPRSIRPVRGLKGKKLERVLTKPNAATK